MKARQHTWDVIRSWHHVVPPSRPSERELRGLARLISRTEYGRPTIAVLGSTPEFRDLAHEMNGAVHVFERSLETYNYMSSLRRYGSDETVIEGDWISTLPAFSSVFDFVLSDLTSGNLPYEHRLAFYKAIAGSLKPSGLFYDKVLTHTRRFLHWERLVERYRRKPLNILTANRFSCEYLFCSDLMAKAGIVDSSAFYDLAIEREPSIRPLILLSELVTPRNCKWYYGRSWDELCQTYRACLNTISTFDDVPESPYFGRLKLFLSKRRDS